jgi:hypothetical protein
MKLSDFTTRLDSVLRANGEKRQVQQKQRQPLQIEARSKPDKKPGEPSTSYFMLPAIASEDNIRGSMLGTLDSIFRSVALSVKQADNLTEEQKTLVVKTFSEDALRMLMGAEFRKGIERVLTNRVIQINVSDPTVEITNTINYEPEAKYKIARDREGQILSLDKEN